MKAARIISSIEEVHKVIQIIRSFNKLPNRNYIHLIPRDKLTQALVDFGFTKDEAKKEVSSLGIRHYCYGPSIDDNEEFRDEGKLWFFKKKIDEGREVYIKLKILEPQGCPIGIKCLSFHEPEHKIDHAFSRELIDEYEKKYREKLKEEKKKAKK